MATMTVTNVSNTADGTQTTPVSASSAAPPPSIWVTLPAMAGVVATIVLMSLAYRYWIKPSPSLKIASSYVPYAGVIAASAALERFLEPLSDILMAGKSTKQTAADKKSEALKLAADPTKSAAGDVHPVVQEAATAAAEVQKLRSSRAVLFWAIASVLGIVISGGFGFFLLQSIATGVNPYLDLAVTGLTIGAGTKPTHDLITSLQARSTGSGSSA